MNDSISRQVEHGTDDFGAEYKRTQYDFHLRFLTQENCVCSICHGCGSEMIEVTKLWIINNWCATCSICNCTGPGEHESADLAARAWNKRYDFKTKSAALYGKNVRGE